MQKVTKPPAEFTMTAIIDNGADWHATGIKPGDGYETGPDKTDRDTAHSELP